MGTLTVIDLSSIFWQSWHAAADQEMGTAFDGTISKVYRHVNGSEPVAIAIDSPPYIRKTISPDYKSQRDKPSAVAVDQLRRVIERFENDGFPVLGAKGYEADDIIATIAARAGFDELHIVSSDKDLLQLVDPVVTATSPLTGEEFGPDEVHAKFGVWPPDLLQWLSLVGDKSDNVPGVPGVGPKTAAAIINGDNVSDSIKKKIEEHKEITETSKRLITLMDNAPIDVSRCFEPRVPKETEPEAEFENELETETKEETTDEPAGEPLPKFLSTSPSTQIVKRESNWALQLEPDDSGKAYSLAKILFDSKLYTKFSNPQSILAVILRGRSLGLDATTSLDGFHVIEGQPSLSAPLKVGLVMRSPLCDFFKCIETTDKLARYVTHRSDDPDDMPTAYTFTIEFAERMGLLRKSRSGRPTQWDKFPNTMLRWRCATELCNMVYPDVVAGIYTPDELSEGQFVDAEIVE